MKIQKTKNGKVLTIALEGRMDSVTAPELKAVLDEELPGPEKLILDIKELQYISSAGLRVILSADKTMKKQGELIVRHPNEQVLEVFDVTGFNEILTIEK